MTHFTVIFSLWILGISSQHPLSSPSSPPLPPLFCLPPRHQQKRLPSPPQSCPSHGMHGVGEPPEFTMACRASGEFSEEPTITASSVDTQTAWVLLNTASQSHLSLCMKQSSIHPPDKIYLPPPPSFTKPLKC